jgi:hypothetical protein
MLDLILNTVFISIPEGLFFLIMVLIFLKRHDLYDPYGWKDNLKKILLPVILPAMLINVTDYFHVPGIVSFAAQTILLYGLIIYLIKKNAFLEKLENKEVSYFKIVFYIMLTDIIVALTEIIYLPVVMTLFDISFIREQRDFGVSLLLSLPSRLIEFMMVLYFIKKKSTAIKYNVISFLTYNKKLAVMCLGFISMIIVSLWMVLKVILYFDILSAFPLYLQLTISALLVSIPVVLIYIFFANTTLLIENIACIQQSHENMFSDRD